MNVVISGGAGTFSGMPGYLVRVVVTNQQERNEPLTTQALKMQVPLILGISLPILGLEQDKFHNYLITRLLLNYFINI